MPAGLLPRRVLPRPKGGLAVSVRYFRGSLIYNKFIAYETTRECIALAAGLIRLSRLIEIEKKVRRIEMQMVLDLQKLEIP